MSYSELTVAASLIAGVGTIVIAFTAVVAMFYSIKEWEKSILRRGEELSLEVERSYVELMNSASELKDMPPPEEIDWLGSPSQLYPLLSNFFKCTVFQNSLEGVERYMVNKRYNFLLTSSNEYALVLNALILSYLRVQQNWMQTGYKEYLDQLGAAEKVDHIDRDANNRNYEQAYGAMNRAGPVFELAQEILFSEESS